MNTIHRFSEKHWKREIERILHKNSCQHFYSNWMAKWRLLLFVLFYGYSSKIPFNIVHWSRRLRLHALYAIIRQKEIRWTLTMIPRDGQRCPRARGHMLWIFMTLPSLHRPDYVPPKYDFTLARYTSRRGDSNVTTIVQLASRRGIISAHCHRLIEFGTDRIAHVDRPGVSVNATHVQCRRKQKGTGFSILSWPCRQCIRQRASRRSFRLCLCC